MSAFVSQSEREAAACRGVFVEDTKTVYIVILTWKDGTKKYLTYHSEFMARHAMGTLDRVVDTELVTTTPDLPLNDVLEDLSI